MSGVELNGGIVGPINTPTGGQSGVASGVWDITEIYEHEHDGVWPEPKAGLYEWIGGYTLSSDGASSFNFTNIPSWASELQVRVYRAEAAGSVNSTIAQHSGQTSSIFWGGMYASNGGNLSAAVTSSTSESRITWHPGANTGCSGFYEFSRPHKTQRAGACTWGGSSDGGSYLSTTTEDFLTVGGGYPLTSVLISDSSSIAWKAGSSIHLYGIRDGQ